MTASLSDALSESSFHFGVCEETGMLDCRIRIRLDGHGGSYSVILRRDCTDCRYEEALRRAGATFEDESPRTLQSITKQDLAELGLSGGKDSSFRWKELLKKLELPEHLNANGLLEALNLLYSKEEVERFLETE